MDIKTMIWFFLLASFLSGIALATAWVTVEIADKDLEVGVMASVYVGAWTVLLGNCIALGSIVIIHFAKCRFRTLD